MSDGDVSLIHDEDVLRRMWQQTEDFSKKKEIRAHMYRLREERLRNLYSPEPTIEKKGCEFSSSQSHIKSFADQTFQSMKSKEVRDAGSPPKEFIYRGQDLKELSNAGWNVQSENKTTDDGHTHVKSIHADIEGSYDVDGGKGQFAAVDQRREASTEYKDDKLSVKRNENVSNTAAREQVVRQTENGNEFSSTTSSSTSSSKFEQTSSSHVDNVPYEEIKNKKIKTHISENEYENLREQGELISKKVNYPDENTRVIVETRCLPDGTEITSTRKEFKSPVVKKSHSEHKESRSESKLSSVEQSSNIHESSTAKVQKYQNKNASHNTEALNTSINYDNLKHDYEAKRQNSQYSNKTSELREERNEKYNETHDDKTYHKNILIETQNINDKAFDDSKTTNKSNAKLSNVKEYVDVKTINDQYQTTYQSDFAQKRISTDHSPTHQAWASSLRADSPSPSSPGSRTNLSSVTSLRSSSSPDKGRKPTSRGGSPIKYGRQSPTRSDHSRTSKTYSSTSTIDTKTDFQSTHETKIKSPERKLNDVNNKDNNEKRTNENTFNSPASNIVPETRNKSKSPTRHVKNDTADNTFDKTDNNIESPISENPARPSVSPDRKPGYMRPTFSSQPKRSSPYVSPERKSLMRSTPEREEGDLTKNELTTKMTKTEQHYKFIDEETKMNTRAAKVYNNIVPETRNESKSPTRHVKSDTTDDTFDKFDNNIESPISEYPARSSVSPDRKPGYMRPTISSQPKRSSPYVSPERKSLMRSTPEREEDDLTKNELSTKMTKTEQHYKFIDEETKMNTRATKVYDKHPSPIRKSPESDRPLSPALKNFRSPSPPKGSVTFTDEVDREVDTHVKAELKTKDAIHSYSNTKENKSINTYEEKYNNTKKDEFPNKYGTYDKKRSTKDNLKDCSTSVDVDIIKVDDGKTHTKTNTVSKPTRNSQSPTKDKYKRTSDFLSTEITTEEINKHNKSHPRQLITPGVSPTRKPHVPESVPSTGQSSPTTSVSEILYFHSPNEHKTIVTDLDDKSYSESFETTANTLIKRPDSLDVRRSPSPSKIPCRSPTTPKEVLPKKSALKKPSSDSLLSPIEKPPTTFQVSPTVEDKKGVPEHKVVKKDRADKPVDKVKPPLERRETYEERCKKILGMMDDNKTATTKTTDTRFSQHDNVTSKVVDNKLKVTQFINQEREDIQTANTAINKSRECSPSKSDKLKNDMNFNEKATHETDDVVRNSFTKQTISSSLKVVDGSSKQKQVDGEQRKSRTPSPEKVVSTQQDLTNTEFITKEKEQEILDKVQKTLKRISPNRDVKSLSREKSPTKTTTSLQDLDIKKSEDNKTEISTKITKFISGNDKHSDVSEKTENAKVTIKLGNNNATVKKCGTSQKTVDDMTKGSNTINVDQSSPRVPKTISTTKDHNSKSGRKPSFTLPTKSEKPNSVDEKKTIKKQNSFTKKNASSTVNKAAQMFISKTKVNQTPDKKSDIPKSNKENVTPKRDDIKYSRTISETAIKTKKQPIQRQKSKPEIHINESRKIATSSDETTNPHILDSTYYRLSTKPKSTIELNTQISERGVIVDEEHAKSSRENSPERICPTPINFNDDVGIPRLPDEINEPDDNHKNKIYHTIHETESIVDDIVEISEEEELFTKKTDINRITDSDECLLSVNDKVSKFTADIDNIKKTKDYTQQFKDTEKKVHSDFSRETGESVSEKVTKFTKEQESVNEIVKIPKNIKDEYDNLTIYQDENTKLSVNDKAHYFVEAAENVTAQKIKPTQIVRRPDLSNVDESLKTDECLLSVSDKVDKFIKTAEQFLNTSIAEESTGNKIRKHEDILDIIEKVTNYDIKGDNEKIEKTPNGKSDKNGSFAKETVSSHAKVREHSNSNLKPNEKIPLKVATVRSSEAVKKAKALFENIASDQIKETKTTKLRDIGVIKKSPKTDSTTALHPSVEDVTRTTIDIDIKPNENERSPVRSRPKPLNNLNKPRETPKSQIPESFKSRENAAPKPVATRPKSPSKQVTEKTTPTKSVLSRYPAAKNTDVPKVPRPDSIMNKGEPKPLQTEKAAVKEDKKINGESKIEEVAEVSSRRGSGKFGVELRRTSLEKSTLSTERRRSSTEHHQPCIEDIFDLDLLDQMLEKVVGYEQRRRIRAQIRVAQKRTETSHNFNSNTYTKSIKSSVTTLTSPEPSSRKATSPERKPSQKPLLNGQAREPTNKHRTQSPEKSKMSPKTRSPTRQPSPDKRTRSRNASPTKTTSTKKESKFNEYATAYIKRVGLDEKDIKANDINVHTLLTDDHKTPIASRIHEHTVVSSLKTIQKESQTTEINGTRTPSPQRKSTSIASKSSADRLYHRSPSPDFKRPVRQEETIIKTVIEKKTPQKAVKEDQPPWISNRNMKTSPVDTRTYSSKKVDADKPKYRAVSPSKVIAKPTDIITSSYGPGPMDADGRPLFGIKALRNGASNYQVRGTVVREEYHSHNGSAPEGSISVTNYSTNPEELEKLLRSQGEPVSRIHGLAAITTTKKFGGNTGSSYRDVHSKEERAAVDQFTRTNRKYNTTNTNTLIEDITNKEDHKSSHRKIEHSKTTAQERKTVKSSKIEKDSSQKIIEGERRSEERQERSRREEKKIVDKTEKEFVRQNSVKSLTEKYIKNASDTKPRPERGSYPKAGLILKTGNSSSSLKDNQGDVGTTTETTNYESDDGTMKTSTTTSKTFEKTDNGFRQSSHTSSSSVQSTRAGQSSFLDSNTKVTGVQDILARMKNADIVIEDGDTTEDSEARALLNKFLGATVLMAGMKGYMVDQSAPRAKVQSEPVQKSAPASRSIDLEQCWDERVLRQLLEASTDYEERRRIRARLRTLMAEQEACTAAVTAALGAADLTPTTDAKDAQETNREEEEVTSVTSSVRRNSSETVSSKTTTTTSTSKVIDNMTKPGPKPASPFAKFRQLEKQNSLNSPNSPKTPQSPSSPGQPYFKFTDPSLQASAATIKERLLQWCRDKTRDYENVKLENFSTSWADGLAFCALVHHFLPTAFDYTKLTAEKRRHNFTLAFKIADEKAGIYPLLDVDDMVAMRKPDWKCVFTYVQSIHRRFKDQD